MAFDSSNSTLVCLTWTRRGIVADFAIPGSSDVLRVHFDSVLIIRVLDEMPLSTESEPSSDEGLVAHHFAYRVDGAHFWNSQSAIYREINPNAQHYCFVTGLDCLDVIANVPPEFSRQTPT